MDNKQNLVEFHELAVSFFTPAGEVKAVNGISYALSSGDALGIVGESGSGKSVSVNALMKLTPYPGRVVGGSMTFDGRDIQSMSTSDMLSVRGKEIAMIFQDPMTSLNPVYTIGNQLIETLTRHNAGMTKQEARDRSIDMLKLCGINNPDQRMRQYPHEFSGGMRQRAMIAMALSCEPKLLIADEPTTALDVTIQAQILELMKELKEKTGTAIILITHDLGIISDLCERVLVMYAGNVVERGTVDEIYYNPKHPYTQGLLRCLPRLDSDGDEPLIPIEGTPVDLLKLPAGCPFASRCDRCMKVCLEKQPPSFDFGDGHESRCWLNAKEGVSAR